MNDEIDHEHIDIIDLDDLNLSQLQELLFRKDDNWYYADEAPMIQCARCEKYARNLIELNRQIAKDEDLDILDVYIWFVQSGPESINFVINKFDDVELIKELIDSFFQMLWQNVFENPIYMMPNGFDMFCESVSDSVNSYQVNDEDRFWKELKSDDEPGYVEYNEDKVKKWFDNRPDKHKQLLGICLEHYKKMIYSGDARFESYGLHGLGHLYHPNKKEFIIELENTKSNPWSKEKEFLLTVRASSIM